jgi:hypothetical protein
MADETVKPKLVIASEETPAARDPTDIFNDLDKLRVESTITIDRRKVLTTCRCSKPDPNTYFRSNPDLRMRLPVTLIRHKQERDLYYYVVPEMRSHPHVERACRAYILVQVVTWPVGETLLWPIPVLGEKPMASDVAQNAAYEHSLRSWTQLAWDQKLRNFSVEVAERADDRKPVWPTESFETLLKLAFAGRIIDNDEHEYVRQLRGIFA